MVYNRNLPPVRQDQFAMVPRGDVPRSKFHTRSTHKTTFDADGLVPIFVDEVLPGDDWRGHVTAFIRMATPVFPIMDNLVVESFFFFTPNRLVWDNWVKFMGERKNPNDSIDFVIPQVQCANSTDGTGFEEYSVGDYFGLPIKGELPASIAGNYKTVSALPFRMYNLIFNEWFRSQDLQTSALVNTDDATENVAYTIRKRNKRHDYFTSALPWPVKANDVPNIPIGGQAPVRTGDVQNEWVTTGSFGLKFRDVGGAPINGLHNLGLVNGVMGRVGTGTGNDNNIFPSNLYADLSEATGATLNAIRMAVATQQLLERDARGGTRYTELLRNHFGVQPQDSRLQRPEYIGGGRFTMVTQAIPQTSGTARDPENGYTNTPLGELGAVTSGAGDIRFSYSATEHGYIIGLINVTGDITYQRGIHRMWTRQTRYDFYWPTFAFLGEQIIRNDELYATGDNADTEAFGYQERWAEYRYKPSKITGAFRSNAVNSLDTWHLSEDFQTRPTLSGQFIQQNTPMTRVLAAANLAAGQQFLFDSVYDIELTRALPLRSVPGLHRF